MTLVDRVSSADAPGAFLADTARSFVPRIRALARQMELARRLDDQLIDDMDAAGLFSVIVPKRWGGAGLGPHELNQVAEIIAAGDVSTAWVTVFYNLHSWFLCRYPLEVQQELFANGPSVRSAAILSQPGTAERSGGQLRVNGSWGYATGMLHASHALVPVIIDGDKELRWVILPREQLDIADDWDVASMAATGSVTITATDAVVPQSWAIPFSAAMSANDHPGTFHDDEVVHLPFSALRYGLSSLCVGALDAAVGDRPGAPEQRIGGEQPAAASSARPRGCGGSTPTRRRASCAWCATLPPRTYSRSPVVTRRRRLRRRHAPGCRERPSSIRCATRYGIWSTATDPAAIGRTTSCAACRRTSRCSRRMPYTESMTS